MSGNVYRVEDWNGLFVWKEWKSVLGLANVEISRLVVVRPVGDLGVKENKFCKDLVKDRNV